MNEQILYVLGELLEEHNIQSTGNGMIRFVKGTSGIEFGHFKIVNQKLSVVVYDRIGPYAEHIIHLSDPNMADEFITLMCRARSLSRGQQPLTLRGYEATPRRAR